jgi:hypothetical protein
MRFPLAPEWSGGTASNGAEYELYGSLGLQQAARFPAAGRDQSYGVGMTEQSNAITVSHPPQAVLRMVNPLMKLLLHTPLMGPGRQQLMVVGYTGRKSGKRYSIPVSAHLLDDILYALTAAPWKHNFRDGAPARVLYNGKTASMRGELIADRAMVADVYSRCAESYGAKRAERSMGLKFADGRIPSRDEFAAAVDQLKLAAVRFTPGPS